MDALSLLAHLMFKTFFLALPVGVAWLAFRRLSMSESRNAWLYSAVGLFASLAAAALAPWALGFAGTSWLVLLTALLCPPVWIMTVIVCDLRQRSYGDDEATDWVIERFTSRRPLPADNPAPEGFFSPRPDVTTGETNQPTQEQIMPVFRHSPLETTGNELSQKVEPILSAEPSFEEPHNEVFFDNEDKAAPADLQDPDQDAETPTPILLLETNDPEIAPVAGSTAVEKTEFRGTEVEAPRNNETRRVLDVARDMRGDGVSRERLMQAGRKTTRNLSALGGTA